MIWRGDMIRVVYRSVTEIRVNEKPHQIYLANFRLNKIYMKEEAECKTVSRENKTNKEKRENTQLSTVAVW